MPSSEEDEGEDCFNEVEEVAPALEPSTFSSAVDLNAPSTSGAKADDYL